MKKIAFVFLLAVLALAPLIVASFNAEPASAVALTAGGAGSTPWVAARGRFVAAVWGETADGKTDVYAAVSKDGGRTFGAAVRVNDRAGEGRLGGELPPRVALLPPAKGGDPGIVVLWTARGDGTAIKLAQSRDGGGTFTAAVSLQTPGAAGDRGWPSLAVDAGGAIHAVWLDHRGLAADAGAHKAHKSGAHDGVAMAQRSGLFYATPGVPERELSRGVCYCCKTALAAGPSGILVAAWRHVYPGNLRDIALSISRDGGRTFSAPSRISEDGWAINGCPDDGPAVVVDDKGTAHIAWPTVLQGPDPERAIFYTSTADGVTFRPRVRVPTTTQQPTHPQILLDRDGRVVVAWDERRDGRTVAAARALRVRPGAEPEPGPVHEISPNGSASYPALAAVDDGLVAVWSTGGSAPRVMARRLSLP